MAQVAVLWSDRLIAVSLVAVFVMSCSGLDKKDLSNKLFYQQKKIQWIYYYKDDLFDAYYDIKSIQYKQNQYAQVWLKLIAKSDEARKLRLSEIQAMKQSSDASVANYDTLDYISMFYELDCINKIYRVIRSEDFDTKGKQINKTLYTVSDWRTITVPSMQEQLYQSVCKL